LEKAKKELEELEEKLKSAMVHSGTAQEKTRLLRHINELVADSGLRVNSLIPGGPVEDVMLQINWTRYEFALSGSFHGFLHLLHALRDLSDPIQVNQIVLHKEGEDSLSITFNLLI
jgi:Tfp pilus assembly protein PilO